MPLVFYYDENHNLRVFRPHHFDHTKRPNVRKSLDESSDDSSESEPPPTGPPPSKVKFHEIVGSGHAFPKSTANGDPPPGYVIPEALDVNLAGKNGKLRVKRSNIKNAGNGLFVKQKKGFRTGQRITTYGGYVLPDEETADASDSAYLMPDEYGRIWDAKYINRDNIHSDLGRWINDPKDTRFSPNCEARLIEYETPREARIEIFAIRPIRGGEEIFLSYGDNYWSSSPKTKK